MQDLRMLKITNAGWVLDEHDNVGWVLDEHDRGLMCPMRVTEEYALCRVYCAWFTTGIGDWKTQDGRTGKANFAFCHARPIGVLEIDALEVEPADTIPPTSELTP